MIVKLLADHAVKHSPTCGEIREILHGAEWSPNIALAFDLQPTVAHWHATFDEIYFVLDGSLEVRLFDPASNFRWSVILAANELCVITRGTHHQVVVASRPNRLCVITTPRFDPADEIVSDKL
jgi:mannose-6-phosphate isomerase-like protein (cupin superfamily)